MRGPQAGVARRRSARPPCPSSPCRGPGRPRRARRRTGTRPAARRAGRRPAARAGSAARPAARAARERRPSPAAASRFVASSPPSAARSSASTGSSVRGTCGIAMAAAIRWCMSVWTPSRVAAAHLVPVVLAQLELRAARQPELADGDEVVEPAVGPALDGEELHQLLPGGLLGQPAVRGGQPVAGGHGPHRPDDPLGVVGLGQRPGALPGGLELVEPRLLEGGLERGHLGGALQADTVAELVERCGVQVVHRQQAQEAVAAVERLAPGEDLQVAALSRARSSRGCRASAARVGRAVEGSGGRGVGRGHGRTSSGAAGAGRAGRGRRFLPVVPRL